MLHDEDANLEAIDQQIGAAPHRMALP